MANERTEMGQEHRAEEDVTRHLSPPFDLTSDMLFVAGLCPTGPLRAAFLRVPFLSIRGRTPLVAWFSLVKQVCYTTATGERQCMGEHEPQNELGQAQEGTVRLYNELNVIALLKRRAFFVPGIYATSELTIQVGRSQGMPKEPTIMSLRVQGHEFRSRVVHGARPSWVRARLVGSGRILSSLLSVAWPTRIWPAIFPSSSYVRASILETPPGATGPRAGGYRRGGGRVAAPGSRSVPAGPLLTRPADALASVEALDALLRMWRRAGDFRETSSEKCTTSRRRPMLIGAWTPNRSVSNSALNLSWLA
ncbi:MAG: hypothetical protein ABI670_03665 [Chloroflexota bacterium]